MAILTALFVCVCLSLKRYISISVALSEQSYNPFYQIPKIEKYIQHFLHLLGVYSFVVIIHPSHIYFLSNNKIPQMFIALYPLNGIMLLRIFIIYSLLNYLSLPNLLILTQAHSYNKKLPLYLIS